MSMQTNIRVGPIVVDSFEDLTGKEGFLVKLVNLGGKPAAALPALDTDAALFVLDDVAENGKATLLPLSPDRNVRVRLQGTCNPGDRLCLGLGDHAGKVRAVPVEEGAYTVRGIAEETGVDGQNLRLRPALLGVEVVEEEVSE